jgi:branched-chain amino acid transport system substrate-binding protein
MNKLLAVGAVAAVVASVGCSAKKGDEGAAASAPAAASGPKADKGVDVGKKVLRVGALNDESGPAAAIGKPFAVGKRVLAAYVNAGGSGLLPDGWTIELIERDHQYNPQQSVQQYNAIKDDVLFIATSFGTPNTLPLRDMLTRDDVIAFPASLSSEMAQHRQTPPLGPSYNVEAMRAMDWAVDQAKGAGKVRAAIVYQKDDYGKDGLDGWKAAAERNGVQVVAEQTVAPGQKDVTAVVSALKQAGATHVLLTTLPSATGPILGTAAQLGFAPIWIGNTPAWIDRFFDASVLPRAVLANFYWVSSLPYWGEDVPGMGEFLEAYEAHGKAMAGKDFYLLLSYVQGLIELEAFRRALANGDVTRAGFKHSLQSIERFDADGLIQPVDLAVFPYVTATRTRVLKPDPAKASWVEIAPYAEPRVLGGR